MQPLFLPCSRPSWGEFSASSHSDQETSSLGGGGRSPQPALTWVSVPFLFFHCNHHGLDTCRVLGILTVTLRAPVSLRKRRL